MTKSPSRGFGGAPPSNDPSQLARMFPTLSEELVARIRTHGEERAFEAGTVLVEQGDESVPFFVVLEGEIEVVHPTNVGRG
jgi:thioredoxin reductase (NADPH)